MLPFGAVVLRLDRSPQQLRRGQSAMNPLDSIWGTIISGVVIAVVLALIF